MTVTHVILKCPTHTVHVHCTVCHSSDKSHNDDTQQQQAAVSSLPSCCSGIAELRIYHGCITKITTHDTRHNPMKSVNYFMCVVSFDHFYFSKTILLTLLLFPSFFSFHFYPSKLFVEPSSSSPSSAPASPAFPTPHSSLLTLTAVAFPAPASRQISQQPGGHHHHVEYDQ